MNNVYSIDAETSEISDISTDDLEKWSRLSEFFRGMLNFGVEPTINLTFPKNDVEGAVKYFDTPTIENYMSIQEGIREFLGINTSNRDEWLKTSYDNIDSFKSQTGKLFIWDTTPDFEEVVMNLIQTLLRYNLKLYVEEYSLYINLLESLINRHAPSIKIHVLKYSETIADDGLLFSSTPKWEYAMNTSICLVNNYFHVSIVDDEWYGMEIPYLFIGDVDIMNVKID